MNLSHSLYRSCTGEVLYFSSVIAAVVQKGVGLPQVWSFRPQGGALTLGHGEIGLAIVVGGGRGVGVLYYSDLSEYEIAPFG